MPLAPPAYLPGEAGAVWRISARSEGSRYVVGPYAEGIRRVLIERDAFESMGPSKRPKANHPRLHPAMQWPLPPLRFTHARRTTLRRGCPR